MILFLLFTLEPKCCKTPFTLFLFLCIFFIFSTFCACFSFFFLWQKNVKKLKRMISTSEHRVKDPFASQNTQNGSLLENHLTVKFFFFQSVKLSWNDIPIKIKNCEGFDHFSQRILVDGIDHLVVLLIKCSGWVNRSIYLIFFNNYCRQASVRADLGLIDVSSGLCKLNSFKILESKLTS